MSDILHVLLSGKHTGTVLGVAYFTAPPKRGTFVKRENLTLFDPELEAVAKIQAGVRGTIAKKKAKQEVAWRTFNTLDADEESRLMQRRTKLLSSVLGARLNRERPEPAALERLERETEELAIEPDYDGPHISWPLTESQVVAMMEAFKDGRRLHLRYAMQILARYRRFAGAMPTLVDVTVKPGTRLTICGDTHGQLQDLFSIFTINGIPSPSNRYLMNGDFVDRGDYSCEILFTLMAFVLLYPSADPGSGAACMLNRGNHESGNQNITGGFMSEHACARDTACGPRVILTTACVLGCCCCSGGAGQVQRPRLDDRPGARHARLRCLPGVL